MVDYRCRNKQASFLLRPRRIWETSTLSGFRPYKMPVFVKDFSWTQTDDHVVVRVPLRGIHPSKVDLFTHNSYIKASFKPFLFEAFLFNSIIESTSKALIIDGEVLFHLEKKDKSIIWESLSVDLSKEEKNTAREQAIQEVQQQQQTLKSKKQELLQDLKRKAVQQQIDLEKKEKSKIEELKTEERVKAMTDLETWKVNNSNDSIPFDHLKDTEQNEKETQIVSTLSCSEIEETSPNEKPICSKDCTERAVHRTSSITLNEEDLKPVPFTRKCGSIKVKFTPRAFPTPQRESKTDEEQEWLKKQAEARRATGFMVEDLRPEECNPQWLKDKGDSFFQMGNYLGAVSAYSHGIKLSEEMASLYVNRSAAHLALGNLRRVIEDTSKALELMVPKVALNQESRARCHARRGAALCRLGMLESGLEDLQQASRLQPQDEKLKTDIAAARSRFQSMRENGEDDFENIKE